MKVKQLIEELQQLNPELLVVLSVDEEGNFFNELCSVSGDNNRYDEEEHTLHLQRLTPELQRQGYTEEDLGEGTPAVVFWP